MDDAVLQGIAEQLSTQITFSNELMSRLQGLETQHITYQRQAAEKQQQLRSALASAESARAEAADLRQKLAASQVRLGGCRRRWSHWGFLGPPPPPSAHATDPLPLPFPPHRPPPTPHPHLLLALAGGWRAGAGGAGRGAR